MIIGSVGVVVCSNTACARIVAINTETHSGITGLSTILASVFHCLFQYSSSILFAYHNALLSARLPVSDDVSGCSAIATCDKNAQTSRPS